MPVARTTVVVKDLSFGSVPKNLTHHANVMGEAVSDTINRHMQALAGTGELVCDETMSVRVIVLVDKGKL